MTIRFTFVSTLKSLQKMVYTNTLTDNGRSMDGRRCTDMMVLVEKQAVIYYCYEVVTRTANKRKGEKENHQKVILKLR